MIRPAHTQTAIIRLVTGPVVMTGGRSSVATVGSVALGAFTAGGRLVEELCGLLVGSRVPDREPSYTCSGRTQHVGVTAGAVDQLVDGVLVVVAVGERQTDRQGRHPVDPFVVQGRSHGGVLTVGCPGR